MNDKEFDLLLTECLQDESEPSDKLNLSLMNQAKRISNQSLLSSDYKKSYFSVITLLLPLAVLLTLLVVLFVISSVLIKIIILANMTWGIILTVALGVLGNKIVKHERGVILS